MRTEECPCLCRMALAVARLPIALLLAADKARIDHEALVTLVAEVEQEARLLQAAGRGEGLVQRQILLLLTSGIVVPRSIERTTLCRFQRGTRITGVNS